MVRNILNPCFIALRSSATVLFKNMDSHNTWSYSASLPPNGSLTLSIVSSPATVADECSSENQAAGLQYLHIPQDLRIGVNELITESLLSVCHEVILTIIVTQAHN
jgi:hypothetical protein